MSFYDPVFRGRTASNLAPRVPRRQASYKCWKDDCLHYIYGFRTAEEREEHIRHHPPISVQQSFGPSRSQASTYSSFTEPRPPQSASIGTTQSREVPQPSTSASMSSLPPIVTSASGREPPRRPSAISLPPPPDFAAQTSSAPEPAVDPLLPPLKRSRVGHSKLESIGELRLPREQGKCLRCKVYSKPVSIPTTLVHLDMSLTVSDPVRLARRRLRELRRGY